MVDWAGSLRSHVEHMRWFVRLVLQVLLLTDQRTHHARLRWCLRLLTTTFSLYKICGSLGIGQHVSHLCSIKRWPTAVTLHKWICGCARQRNRVFRGILGCAKAAFRKSHLHGISSHYLFLKISLWEVGLNDALRASILLLKDFTACPASNHEIAWDSSLKVLQSLLL